jgi:hypothetical protein
MSPTTSGKRSVPSTSDYAVRQLTDECQGNECAAKAMPGSEFCAFHELTCDVCGDRQRLGLEAKACPECIEQAGCLACGDGSLGAVCDVCMRAE